MAWRVARWVIWTRRAVNMGSPVTKSASGGSRASVAKAVDFGAVGSVQNAELQAHGLCRHSDLLQSRLSIHRIGRVDEHGNAHGSGHHLAQQFHPLCCQLPEEKIEAGDIAAWLARGW